ncbi:MAG: hypothetical protein WCT16_03525 [Candidatus Buchananbacteria bacterium]
MATGMESTPNCVCGKNDWQDHGGYFGSELQQRGMRCLACGGISTFISAGGGNIFIIPNEKSDHIPQSAIDWVNKTVLPTWRARWEKIKQARKPLEEACWQSACQKLDLPIGTKGEDVPEDKHEEWRKIFDELYTQHSYRIPVGFECPPIPAQMPEGITCYVQTSAGIWRWVPREETLVLTQPSDPIRVRHDDFFNHVFTELANNLGVESIAREEVPNEYCGAANEPWYCFKLGNNTIKLGPRKRVYSIKIQAPNGFETKQLRAVTVDEYNNTYWDGSNWHGNAEISFELEVHAWNKEQLMRLLGIVARQCFVNG